LVQDLETRLLKAILGSFFFSLLPVAVVFEHSDWSFRAIVELLGGLMGAAGFLAAYLGSIRHPREESGLQQLERHFVFWGTKATVEFSGAAAMLYLFYVFGKSSDPASLLFLSAGNFLAFYGFTETALRIREAETRKLIWSSMTAAQREAWLRDQDEREKQLQEYIEKTKRENEKIKKDIEEVNRDTKRIKAAERAIKVSGFFSRYFLHPTYRLRKRLGLVMAEERFQEREVEKIVQGFFDAKQSPIKSIRRNEVRPLVLEGSGLNLFPVDGQKVVLIEGALDSAGAKDLLQKLDVLERDDKGKLKDLMAAIGISAKVTYEARELLRDAGIEVVDEKPEAAISNQVVAAE